MSIKEEGAAVNGAKEVQAKYTEYHNEDNTERQSVFAEEWRLVVGFENDYAVSNLGRVMSFVRDPGGAILRPRPDTSGHLQVHLRDRWRFVHHLVLEAFVGPRPPGLETRHKNGRPEDNRLANLEYSSRARNHLDRKYHAGVRGWLRIDAVIGIKKRLAENRPGDFQRVIAKDFGVSQTAICAIKLERTHRHVEAAS
jgi:hypothetical protein